jgi:glucose/arabinose dehydrogenase
MRNWLKVGPAVIALIFLASQSGHAATLPSNFSESVVTSSTGSTWNEATGITFAADGTMFVWERAGRIWMKHDSTWHKVIDIAEEVGGWRDFGLLGVALHPNFLNNGQIFLLYVVDRHHLLHFGTPQYNPNTNEYFNATIGRITRYTLDPAKDFHEIVPDSRMVLVGETKQTGFPILHESHGVGQLVFGADDTLLASCGDGASYIFLDTGGTGGGAYGPQALADGIIKPKENVGAFRSQLIDSHSGKLIRIDPVTGDGLPTNPFYDASAPRAAKSRVWALGLRNPCRISLRPNTGSHLPEDGDPGAIYIGDVGANSWEELDVCTGPAQNFGWPLYEGLTAQEHFPAQNIANQDAPNPLFGQGGCTQQYFYFKNLLVQDTLNSSPSYPNPCNANVQIPANIPKFIHRRPSIDWGRPSGPSRTGIYSGNNAAVINVGAAGSPVTGPQFGGNCSIGGAWYSGSAYPAQFQNTYFNADYGTQWIRAFTFNAQNKPTAVQNFATGTGEIVAMAAHPITGDLYYSKWTQVFKISYNPSGNQPPVAVATSDVTYGPSPLIVNFNGSGSSDPNNQVLTYSWNFGDGGSSTQANPQHTFNAPAGVPTLFNVVLTVKDTGNLTATDSIIISVNNTPPTVAIVSPVEGSTFPMDANKIYNLVANITDAEQDAGEFACSWEIALHHNAHNHPETPITDCATTMTTTPVGCDGNTYFYRTTFTVTDAAGLSASDFVDVYPSCDPNIEPIANDDGAQLGMARMIDIDVLANDSDADGKLDPATVAIIQQPMHGFATVDPLTGVVTYEHDGSKVPSDTFTYTVNDSDGGTSNLANVDIIIEPANYGDIAPPGGNGIVDVDDLLAVINAWGACLAPPAQCPADIAPLGPPMGDGVVNVDDLLAVINNWG